MKKVLVIGAINIDIIGTSDSKIIWNESNLGNTTISLGGVAKNIVTNLKYLKANVSFLTLIGSDDFSKIQIDFLKKSGIDYYQSFQKDVISSSYLALHDESGDLVTAINSMKSFEELSVDEFKSKHKFIDLFDVLVLDTNLSAQVLEYLISTYKNKLICVDGVSQSKVRRIEKVIKYIDLLKINNYELNALVKKDNCDIIEGVQELHNQGLTSCVISAGDKDILYNVGTEIFRSHIESVKDITSTMGAGDALFSGIIYKLVHDESIHEAIEFGKRVATETLKVREANNIDIGKLI